MKTSLILILVILFILHWMILSIWYFYENLGRKNSEVSFGHAVISWILLPPALVLIWLFRGPKK